jgi:hypothetical protein
LKFETAHRRKTHEGSPYEDAMHAAENVHGDAPASVPDEIREELRRRRGRYLQHPASGRTWERVKQQARAQHIL